MGVLVIKRWLLSTKDVLTWRELDKKSDLTFSIDKIPKKGDIVVIYKSSPHSHLSHIFNIEKDAGYNEYADSDKERYIIKINNKMKLPNPISLNDMKKDLILEGWLKNFPDLIYEIPMSVWIKLVSYILEKNPNLIKENPPNEKTPLEVPEGRIEDLILKVQEYAKMDMACSIPNEAVTEEVIINPFLRFLGWDTSDPCEIRREYSIGRKKVDYALRCKESNAYKAFLEVKHFNLELKDKDYEQIMDYCISKNVALGILTNGVEWIFYKFEYSKQKQLAERIQICNLNVCHDDEDKVQEIMGNLVSKESLITDNAINYAKEMIENSH